MLLLTCFTVQAAETPKEREEAIAKHDVWHAAKLRGVSFRAIGQEPGWLLEITDGEKIFLSTAYGQTQTTYPYVEPETHPEERWSIFKVKDENLEVTIKGVPCTDIMSGEKFEVSVFVNIDGNQLQGCGRALY